jgi:hypothetical protein
MLNTSREISRMIFSIEKDATFSGTTVMAGFNVVERKDNQYFVFRLNNLYTPYATILDSEMHNLLKLIFEDMLEGGYLEDDGDDAFKSKAEKKKEYIVIKNTNLKQA